LVAADGQKRTQGGGALVFGDGQAVAGQCSARRGVGVQRIGFTLAAACSPIGTADLGHFDSRGLEHPCQARAVAGGAFHPGNHDAAKALSPLHRGVVAGWTGREFGVCQGLPGIGDDRQMVSFQMGVGADDDAP
jgi:hypothetical protein